MSKKNFFTQLTAEVDRLKTANISKIPERVIQKVLSPVQVQINDKPYLQFNSNDYLGLRKHPALLAAEHAAAQKYGTGPGAVRFISGTFEIYTELEAQLAAFHGHQAALLASSAFAINIGVLHALLKPQSKDSLLDPNVLVLSDALNHRSIIDGIRVANLPSSQRITYPHLDIEALATLLEQSRNQFSRAVVITDGIFSMLGEAAPLAQIREVVDRYDQLYSQGVLLVVDDSHGVGVYGQAGRGVEEVAGVHADVLIGTLGKAFGSDGGYVVGSEALVAYLRESTATYIYSNSIAPGSAAAALAGLAVVRSAEGTQLRQQVQQHIQNFQTQVLQTPYHLAKQSDHPIQPLLIGDSTLAAKLTEKLFTHQILVTNISYPIVPRGADELRIQLNAHHTPADLERLFKVLSD